MAKYFDAETGQELRGPEIAEAQAAGRLAVRNDQPLVVRDTEGGRVEIAPSDLGDYQQRGYTLESDEQTAREELIQDANRSPITAGAEALARGATFGLSDVAATAIGGDAYAERATARRESLAGMGTALELVGGIAPALTTGGSSLAARALAATPAGLAARGAASVGARAEAALLARGVAPGLARVAALAAEGSIDGALSGVGQELSEASLGDTELTAEQLVASGAMGALMGLSAGAGIGAATSKLRSVASRYESVTPGSVADEVAPGLVPKPDNAVDGFKILPNWAKSSLAARSSDPELVGEVLSNPSLRADILNKTRVESELNQEIRDSLGEAINLSHVMRDVGAGAQKVDNLRATIRTDTADDALRIARDEVLTPWRQQLDDMAGQELLEKAEHKRLLKELDLVESQVNKGFAGDGSDVAEAYYALDRYKASFGKITEKAANATGDYVSLTKAAQLRDGADAARGKLQSFLEREDLFGSAAAAQRERNALWSKAINSGRMFNRELIDQTGRGLDDGNWFVKERYVQGDKVDRFLGKLVDPKNTTEVQLVREHMRDMRDLFSTVLRNKEIPDAQVPQFEKAAAGFDRALKALDDGETRLKKIGAFDALSKAEDEATGFAGSFPLLGGLVGGAPGVALGTVAQVAARPVGMTRKLMQLEAMAQHQLQTKALVGSRAKSALARLALPPARRGALPTRIATRASTRLFGSDRRESKDRVKRIEERLKQFRTNPELLVTAMASQAGDFTDSAPQTIMQAQATTQRAMQFLASKLPKPTTSNYLLQQQLNASQWTPQDVDRFANYTAAIAEPLSVLDDLEAGRLDQSSIEAVRAVYPKLYQDMQVAVTEQLAQQIDEVPHDAAVQLSMLFGLNGIPTLDAQFQRTYQGLQQQQKQKQQQPANPGQAVTKGPEMTPSFADQLSQGLERP